jgi:hypothetical protein
MNLSERRVENQLLIWIEGQPYVVWVDDVKEPLLQWNVRESR